MTCSCVNRSIFVQSTITTIALTGVGLNCLQDTRQVEASVICLPDRLQPIVLPQMYRVHDLDLPKIT